MSGSFFYQMFKIFLGLYFFFMDPDPYQSSARIRIRNEFVQILDPDPYQNGINPQHCLTESD